MTIIRTLTAFIIVVLSVNSSVSIVRTIESPKSVFNKISSKISGRRRSLSTTAPSSHFTFSKFTREEVFRQCGSEDEGFSKTYLEKHVRSILSSLLKLKIILKEEPKTYKCMAKHLVKSADAIHFLLDNFQILIAKERISIYNFSMILLRKTSLC